MNQYQQRRSDINREIVSAINEVIGTYTYGNMHPSEMEQLKVLAAYRVHIGSAVLNRLDERNMLRITEGGGRVAK